MDNTLKGKTALVTGASRGIGRAIALALAEISCRILLHYHQNEKAAQECLKMLHGTGHQLIRADLSDIQQLRNMADTVLANDRKLDILVNNAGVYYEGDILSLDFEEWKDYWDKTIQTNLDAPAHLSFIMAKRMKERGGMRIINISSRGAFRGEPDAPFYGASKAGLNAMGQSMAKAFARFNILVYTVAPGYVDTEMGKAGSEGPRAKEIQKQSPLNRIARPEEIAKLVLFLAREAPKYMTSAIIDVNGASYLRS